MIAANFSNSSVGSEQIARVPSRQVRRRRTSTFPSAVGLSHEDSLRHQRVEVNICIQRRAETLNRGDGPADAVRDTTPGGSSPLEAGNRTNERGQHGTTQSMIPGQRVTQPVRQRQHPLPHRQATEHTIDKMRRQFGHAPVRRKPMECEPPATRRAESAPFAGEGHEQLVFTALTTEARQAVRPNPAGQELAQLTLDEGRQSIIATAQARLAQERFEVLPHDLMQESVLRAAADGRASRAPTTLGTSTRPNRG